MLIHRTGFREGAADSAVLCTTIGCTTTLPPPGRSLSSRLKTIRLPGTASRATTRHWGRRQSRRRWMKRRTRSRRATTSSRWRRRRGRRTRPWRTATAGRLLDRSISLEHGRLAAGCRHRVGLVALLDGDDVAGDADDLEGTVVGGGERRGLLVTPDKNESSARREVDQRAS